MSVRVLLIGDMHVKHDNKTETDIMHKKLIKIIKNDTNIDFVVVLGDTLHTNERIDSACLGRATKILSDLQKYSKLLIILIGNHDYKNNNEFLTDTHPFNMCKLWPKTIVVDDVTIVEVFSKGVTLESPSSKDRDIKDSDNNSSDKKKKDKNSDDEDKINSSDKKKKDKNRDDKSSDKKKNDRDKDDKSSDKKKKDMDKSSDKKKDKEDKSSDKKKDKDDKSSSKKKDNEDKSSSKKKKNKDEDDKSSSKKKKNRDREKNEEDTQGEGEQKVKYKFLCVPYVPSNRFADALATINLNINKLTKFNGLFSHQEFAGTKMNLLSKAEVDNYPLNAPINFVGHEHNREIAQSNLIYTGTPIQHGFADTGDKTVSLVEYFPDKSFREKLINLHVPRKFIINLTPEELSEYVLPENFNHIKLKVKGNTDIINRIMKLKHVQNIKNTDNVKIQIIDTGIIKRISTGMVINTQISFENRLQKEISSKSEDVQKYFKKNFK